MSVQVPAFSFSLAWFCQVAPLHPCVAIYPLTQPLCYSRNLSLAGGLFFEPAAAVAFLLAAPIVVSFLFLQISQRPGTSVGRKQLKTFFYAFTFVTLLDFFLYTNIIPFSWPAYQYFSALQVACATTSLFYLFLVGSHWARLTVWPSCSNEPPLAATVIFTTLIFVASFFSILLASHEWIPLRLASLIALVFYLVLPAVFAVGFFLSQLILLVNTRRVLIVGWNWSLGTLFLSTFSFLIGQICLLGFNPFICEGLFHLADGLAVSAIGNTFGILFLYKYWDSITREDSDLTVKRTGNPWKIAYIPSQASSSRGKLLAQTPSSNQFQFNEELHRLD